MSKAPRRSRKDRSDDLRKEYRFDYKKSRVNRFAAEVGGSAIAVVLDPDVARVFDSSASVNELLRSVISALPEQAPSALRGSEAAEPHRGTAPRRTRGKTPLRRVSSR